MSRVFHFILSHSIFIALCAAALSVQTIQLLQLPTVYYRCGFIGFATLAGYNAYWITTRLSRDITWDFRWLLQHIGTGMAMILIGIIGMWWCQHEVHLVMYNVLITFLLLVLYAIPLLPTRTTQFTRQFGVLKTSLLAFTWTHVTILIPLQKQLIHLTEREWLFFVQRFCYVFLLCILFDKRDAVIDKMRGLHSLATDIPVSWLHVLSGCLWGLYVGIVWYMKSLGFMHTNGLLLAGLAVALVYLLSLRNRGYVFYYFVVDGMLFLTALLTSIPSI